MTTLQHRPHPARPVVDLPLGVVDAAHQRDEVLANVTLLGAKARQTRVDVIWVQHADARWARAREAWPIEPELAPAAGDPPVGDAHTTEDPTAWRAPPPAPVVTHTNLHRPCQSAPGRQAGTVASRDVDVTPAA